MSYNKNKVTSIKIPNKLVKMLLETVEESHETNNDPVIALDILITFYRKYSTELYKLAQFLEKTDKLTEDQESSIRLFYGAKGNYNSFKEYQ